MKGMPLPFDFEGKGVLDLELVVKNKAFFSDSSYLFKKNCFGEPTSVLDSAKFPSRPVSSSTLSSSLGGSSGGGAASTDTAGVGANPSPKWHQYSTTATSSNASRGAGSELLPVPPALEIGTTITDKCNMAEWESVLSESADVSPVQEQSVFRWIMGDVEDPGIGSLNKFLQIGAGSVTQVSEFEFSNGGFGIVDQGFGGVDHFVAPSLIPSNFTITNRSTSEKISSLNNFMKFPPNSMNLQFPVSISNQVSAIAFDPSPEMKPPIFNPQLLINHHQAHRAQNPSFFSPLSYPELQQGGNGLFAQPPAKRHNSGSQISSKGSLLDTGQQAFPHYRPPESKISDGDDFGQVHQQQQAIIDQLFKAAELVQSGDNPVLAQGILARLNHQLSLIGKPFHRAAFYFKEALLQLLLQTHDNNNHSVIVSSPFNLIHKIGAYKSFSEISPLVQFANFTCTQAILESLEGFDRIHIVDFDIGFGGQWASLMQELALRNGGAPALKITVLASLETHDHLELSLARENLIQFASEINLSFEFDIISVNSMNSYSWAPPLSSSDSEGVAVNLPVGSHASYQLSLPMVLHFVKQLSPKIVVSIDRGCDRTDLPFANHMIHALQSNMNFLESLDAVNMNMDALQKIERFLIQPGIEKIVKSRFHSLVKTQHWKTLLLSSGFSPLAFSNFTESQAEYVVKRTPVRGYQVEKRQSSLVLCWQHKELISVTAWMC